MPYEIDFLGIDKEGKDADAICFRYWDVNENRYIICVYDGGTLEYGEALHDHLSKYYFDGATPKIDFAICSHSDSDHASGLSIILEKCNVSKLILNRPWIYIDELFEKIKDGRITRDSLKEQLEEAYSFAKKLEQIALEKNIPIATGFINQAINERLTILSPSKEFFIDLIAESNKTPSMESNAIRSFVRKAIDAVKSIFESWKKDSLREDVSTSSENETSIVIHGIMDEEKFLLTGDVGIRGLQNACEYANSKSLNLKEIDVYQIPHHGGRHNVSPSILNDLVGSITEENVAPTKTAFVSVAKKSDHPREMVTNAFLRRGCEVFIVSGSTVCHNKNMPDRPGWNRAQNKSFESQVEDWND